MSDLEPFIEIGYPSELESLELTSAPTQDSANQRQGKRVRYSPIITQEAPNRGVQSTNVALPPTPNTTLERKSHQDSNSDDKIPSHIPKIQEKVLQDNTTNSARQSPSLTNKHLSTTSSGTSGMSPDPLLQDPSCEGLQMAGLRTILDEFQRLIKLPNPDVLLQVLEKHGKISSGTASVYGDLVASAKPPAREPPAWGPRARWPPSSTNTLFLHELEDAQLEYTSDKENDGPFVPKLDCDGRPCVKMDQETLLMFGETLDSAGTYDALATFCHLTIRLNNLWLTKNPDNEKQYKTLRAYAIELESFAYDKWPKEMQTKYGAGTAADVNNRRCQIICYIILLIGQTVMIDSSEFRYGCLQGRLDWAVSTFDLERVKFQINKIYMPQPEFQLSKLGTEFHITIEGNRRQPLEELFPESFPRDGGDVDSTTESAKTPCPSASDVGPPGLKFDPWYRGL